MNEMQEYRARLLDRFPAAAQEFRVACLAVKDPFAPAEEGGWNVHQLAAHTRDVQEQVYGLRARRTMEEDNPEFPGFDGDAYMAEHYDPHESLAAILDGLTTDLEALGRKLKLLPDEAWARVSRHVTQGSGLTLQLWVERSLAHIEEHLATVRQAK